ncbi:MAG TPA: hypothetical protein DIT19_04175 [Desulfonauticus sp.]|nr:hypothetical protein [Desulfonauticus sp.]
MKKNKKVVAKRFFLVKKRYNFLVYFRGKVMDGDVLVIYGKIFKALGEKMEVLIGESASISVLRASWRLVKKEYPFLAHLNPSSLDLGVFKTTEVASEELEKGLQEFLNTVLELFSDLVGGILTQKLEEVLLKCKEEK